MAIVCTWAGLFLAATGNGPGGEKSVAYRYSLSPVGHVEINMGLEAVTCVCKWVGVGSKGEEGCAVGLLGGIDRRRFGRSSVRREGLGRDEGGAEADSCV